VNLKSIIVDGQTVLGMAPEELALGVLRSLNASDDRYQRRGQRETVSFTNYCNVQAQQYTSTPQVECARAIGAAFQHLVTIGMLIPSPHMSQWGWFQLTHRAKSVKDAADYELYRHASRYPRGAIHPAIERNSYSEFMKGDYDTAVFKAFKTLEDAVRSRAGFGNDSIGVPLMRKAFHPDDGPLRDESELWAEREALMHLMAGAIGRFKNPASHRFTGLDDPVTTMEIIQLASLLLRIGEQRGASPAAS
jgi:uncharacterized protein (TIGR02391 family)